MIGVYTRMVQKGVISIDEVPEVCREDVRNALDQV